MQPQPRDIGSAHANDHGEHYVPAPGRQPGASGAARPRVSGLAYKIAFLAANPVGTAQLRLDEEARDIEHRIRESLHRDAFAFRAHWALRVDDLQQVLLDERPTIVHFSGHGQGTQGIVVHGDDGHPRPVVGAALGQLFAVLGENVRIVVLNACCTLPQAEAIAEQVDIVIGMSAAVDDQDSRHFAAAFYGALCSGRSVGSAFRIGLNAIQLHGPVGIADAPVLRVRSGIDADALVFEPTSPGLATRPPGAGRRKLAALATLVVLLIAGALGALWRQATPAGTWQVAYDFLVLEDRSMQGVLGAPAPGRAGAPTSQALVIHPAEFSSDTAGGHAAGWAAWRAIFRAARSDARPDQTYTLLHITNRGSRAIDEIDLTSTELRTPTRIRGLGPGESIDVPVAVTGRHANVADPQRLSFTMAEERVSGEIHVVRLPALDELAFREIAPGILRGAPP